MSRIAIVGAAGRMGRTLAGGARDAGSRSHGRVERLGSSWSAPTPESSLGVGRLNVPIEDDLAAAANRFDTLIDFTTRRRRSRMSLSAARTANAW